MGVDGRKLRVDRDRPVAVRLPAGRHTRRAVHGPHLRTRVRRAGGRVEGGVLDRVTHAVHVFLAHRFDVEQRAAVREPELAVVRVVDAAAEVHEVRGGADVELDVLQDRRNIAVAEVERALRTQRIDRARGHPLFDRDLLHLLARTTRVHERHTDAVLEMSVQEPLPTEHGELGARQSFELHGHFSFASAITVSISAKSASVMFHAPAAAFAATCSGFVAPAITLATTGRASSHANASSSSV